MKQGEHYTSEVRYSIGPLSINLASGSRLYSTLILAERERGRFRNFPKGGKRLGYALLYFVLFFNYRLTFLKVVLSGPIPLYRLL